MKLALGLILGGIITFTFIYIDHSTRWSDYNYCLKDKASYGLGLDIHDFIECHNGAIE